MRRMPKSQICGTVLLGGNRKGQAGENGRTLVFGHHRFVLRVAALDTAKAGHSDLNGEVLLGRAEEK